MPKHSLKKAMALHKKHITKPKTATAKSQRRMMDLMEQHEKREMRRKAK